MKTRGVKKLSKKRKVLKVKVKEEKCCHNCTHCLYVGEGDSVCDEDYTLVLDDWEPTDDYYNCGGKNFEQN